MMKNGIIHIGTSGWLYGHWDKVFYPEGIAKEELLPFYSEFFDTVEINSTFYHLPTDQSVKNWYKRVDKNFVFSVKLSRYITHTKKLLCDKKSVDLFFNVLKPLKSKLKCILIQLPPSFTINHERLETFFKMLPQTYHYTVEFRNESWFTYEIMELLNKFNVALCIADIVQHPLSESVTANFVYMRLHGSKRAYKGKYGIRGLKPWASKIQNWINEGKDVYCYFDNDEKGYAVSDAQKIQSLLLKNH